MISIEQDKRERERELVSLKKMCSVGPPYDVTK